MVFDKIVVRVGNREIDPSEHGLDVEYVEQEKMPRSYLENLFSELWLTGRFSHNEMKHMIEEAAVYGVSGGYKFLLGHASDFAFEWETTGGKAYE